MSRRATAALASLLAAACGARTGLGDPTAARPSVDAGTLDAGTRDAGRRDAAVADAAVADAGPDAGAPLVALGLAAGGSFTCAIVDGGEVACWGANSSGQLGDGTLASHGFAVRVHGVSNARQLAAEDVGACALDASGTVWCWGNGVPEPRPDPTLAGAVAIGAGSAWTCAVRADRRVVCRGADGAGQLGPPASPSDPSVSGVTEAIAVCGGGSGSTLFTCALTVSGLVCWGHTPGEDPPHGPRPTGDAGNTLACGGVFVCVGQPSGSVVCRGGPLSDSPLDPWSMTRTSPIDAVSLTANLGHVCASDPTGFAYCWGLNPFGQLGDGTTTPQREPARVLGLDGVLEVVAGNSHSCARAGDSHVHCWGANDSLQLGDATGTARSLVPTTVLMP